MQPTEHDPRVARAALADRAAVPPVTATASRVADRFQHVEFEFHRLRSQSSSKSNCMRGRRLSVNVDHQDHRIVASQRMIAD